MIENFSHHSVLGVRIDDLSLDTLRLILRNWLMQTTPRIIVTPNPEFVLLAQKDHEFRHILNESDLCLPDGVGLRFAVAALSDDHLKHRHTGADTLIVLAELCRNQNQRLVLLGGAPKKTARAAAWLRDKFPGLEVTNFDPGIIDDQHVRLSEATLAGVERLEPQVLAVALGQGKQEKVMKILQSKIPGLKILIGIGGSADYVSQAVRRAPAGWQRLGFEWLWRLIQEPWRWKRILSAVVVFPLKIVWTALRQRRILSACRRVIKEIKLHFADAT